MKIIEKQVETESCYPTIKLENGWTIVFRGEVTEVWVDQKIFALKDESGWRPYRLSARWSSDERYPSRLAAMVAARM
ncbi:hypothetical protein [Paraburkholderia sp. BL10I2N1]|uniref:hypothetical protein n=1 Tax=Paraburkholderia sp. BL10I2N1 TaxID=1938796 RepID=UPI00105EF088|nr:hypothetical protein [Paraburkholderia sp. BL10I2N1]TDN70455.1 hypothetical protein B0G77_3929 [Paraburkholderia sp. BL10I2N1]